MRMNVNRISSSKVVNLYNVNKRNIEKKQKTNENDSIQISHLGKNLSTYSLDDKFINSREKVQQIKDSVENGTYKLDSQKIANKMLQRMKEKL